MNRRVQALQGLDLTLEEGQVFGLLGPNGAGKSTTIKILMNLVQPTGGSAQLFGAPPSSAEARRQVGFLPENPNPYEYLTGGEFLRLAGNLAGMSGKSLETRIAEVLESVDMSKAKNLQIRRYSKGMTQRIGLAQALIHRPKLLILDEPTSGMDPVGRRRIRDLILEERSRGTTVLFCTHIISDVETLCDRVAVLVGGRKVREGAVKDLLTSQTPLIEATLEGIAIEQLHSFGIALSSCQELQGRTLVRIADQDTEPLLRKVLDAGGRVRQLSPARFSLEDLFLDALKESKSGSVGGEIFA
jgi:ABC-2 type transport system ATP-binding protein